MLLIVQQIIVAILVLSAALVSAWKLMPSRRRLRMLTTLDALLLRHRWLPAWRQRTLARRIQAATGAGCAGCGSNPGFRQQSPPR